MAMTEKRLVLHVGPHKTASSYIQENLYVGRRFLREHGWFYPKAGMNSKIAHHHLAHNSAQYLADTAPHHAELLSLAEKTRKTGQNLILSAEGFCRWKPDDFVHLADLFGLATVDLVYVVRDPLDVFHSFWSEEVKQGRTLGFADRFAQEFASPLSSRILNPMNDLAPLLANKRIRLHVVPYDIVRHREMDIYEHICQQVLGLDETTASHVKHVNTMYPVELTEFLRLLTLMYAGDKQHIGSAFRLRFISKTNADERQKLGQLIQTDAADARRVIKVPRNVIYKKNVENLLKSRLKTVWTLDVRKEDLFQAEEKRFVYYNEYRLWNTDSVRSAAEKLLKRLAD